MSDVIFYGVAGDADGGHQFYQRSGSAVCVADRPPLPAEVSRAEMVDARWCFSAPILGDRPFVDRQPQGRGFIHRVAGWTVISWWDRSGDSRMGSNAVFFVRGDHPWAEALRRAREAFPREMKRMEAAYSIGLAGADLPDPGDDPAAAVEVVVCREVERLRALPPDIQTEVRRRMGWVDAPHIQPATNA